MKDVDQLTRLREYILGNIEEGAELAAMEERLLTDPVYFEQLAMAEEELVQDYVDGRLPAADSQRFEKRFLTNEENRRRVKFAKSLRKHIDRQPVETKDTSGFLTSLLAFLTKPAPAFALLAIILGLGGFLVWNNLSGRSEIDISLNKAYSLERPLDSRISDMDYAPVKNVTRGNESDKVDKLELENAKLLALKAVRENASAENLHSLGKVYLAERDFAKAIEQFEKAVKLGPNIARLRNDLGVTHLERSKIGKDDRLRELDMAVKEFDAAIAIDPMLAEAVYNKANALEEVPLPSEAKQAWSDYLKLDSSSRWAEDARRKIESLNSAPAREQSASELEDEFLAYFRQGDQQGALRLLEQNRELIEEKYMPQRLAISYVNASVSESPEKFEALAFLGRLEKERINDRFASDIASVYAEASETRLRLMKDAQKSVTIAYQQLRNGEFNLALSEFQSAMQKFLEAGNLIEANTICKHFIGYIYYFKIDKKEAVRYFEEVSKFCEDKGYKWFYLMNSLWLTGAKERIGIKPTTEVRKEYDNALLKAEEINDAYLIQKYLHNLAGNSNYVKQDRRTEAYLFKLLKFTSSPNNSTRQKFRNLNSAGEMLVSIKLGSLSRYVALQTIKIAEESGDSLFVIDSQINNAVVLNKLGEREEAVKWLDKAETGIGSLNDSKLRETPTSKLLMKRGHLERERGNYERSIELYAEAANILKTHNTPEYLYESKKSSLMALQALSRDEEVGRQLPETLELAEKNRERILDEQERHSFFDNEQTVYDVAIEHEIRRGDNKKAFDYAELSNSRSLLDWLQKGANVMADKEKVQVLFNETATPLTADDIQARMPDGLQILQYTVLQNRIQIWLISKEKFIVRSSVIDRDALEHRVSGFVANTLSERNGPSEQTKQISHELFKTLIGPVEADLDSEEKIAIVPNNVLFHLPFAALTDQDGRYFIEKHVFFYSPSSNVLVLSSENAENKDKTKDENLLSIGNPAFNRTLFPDLPDLPAARDEATEITKLYKHSTLLTDSKATRNEFLTRYKDHDIINFAGHYAVEPQSPINSKLIMADSGADQQNYITNAELMSDKLPNTKLVVLSACRTGVEGYFSGEGMMGLSRTFLAAGVPLVVASQWDVDSGATLEIIGKFHLYRRQNRLSSIEALRRSQLDMLENSTNNFRSPYYWAAFASFGGYADF